MDPLKVYSTAMGRLERFGLRRLEAKIADLGNLTATAEMMLPGSRGRPSPPHAWEQDYLGIFPLSVAPS